MGADGGKSGKKRLLGNVRRECRQGGSARTREFWGMNGGRQPFLAALTNPRSRSLRLAVKEIRKSTHLIVIFGVITRCVSPSSASLAASLAMNSIVCFTS